MKRVLITGGAGFMGHHFIQHMLINTDWEIVCLDRLDTSGNLNRISEILEGRPEYKKRFKFVFHDLKAEINGQIAKQIGNVQGIFHLAASSHVDRSIVDPLGFVNDNVVGTCNILNFARSLDGLEFFQNFSTDEVYGECPIGHKGHPEWATLNSKNPYAATKAGAEQLGVAFANTYGLPIITTNCMNIIGERQHPEKFLPMCIKKILNGEKIFIHSYPNKEMSGTRFYVHARNVADVCLWLADGNAKVGSKYHLLGQEEVSNLDFALFIAKVIGSPVNYELVDFHSDRPGHDLRYGLTDNRITPKGYKYPVEFWESFERTVIWTLKNQRWLEE